MNECDFGILKTISLPSYDNGYVFTDRTRLNAIITIASQTKYLNCIEKNRFLLFTKKPLGLLPDRLTVISTHIDASKSITDFFAEKYDHETLRGSFDNTLTNAAALSLMMDGELPDNIIFAFTGDEEENGLGALDVVTYLRKAGKGIFAIVLDVTDCGYGKVHFTVENDFWRSKCFDDAIRGTLSQCTEPYRFVCSGSAAPYYVPSSYIERNSDGGVYEALCDESWAYDEEAVECFSLCIPVLGAMHSNEGILCKIDSFTPYKSAIRSFSHAISEAQTHTK